MKTAGKIEWTLPRYLDCGTADGLYEALVSGADDDTLEIDLTTSGWVEHFELQKMATQLAAFAQRFAAIVIKVPSMVTEENRRAADVVTYAAAAGFFSYLAGYFDRKLQIAKGNDAPSAFEPHAFTAYVAGLREQSNPSRRIGFNAVGGYPHSSLPLQSIVDWRSVDELTERFATGQQLKEMLERHGTLDVIASGEFATLIVNEVAENIVEHAFEGITIGAGAISLAAVQLGNRDDPDSRVSVRLKTAPDYEQEFLREARMAVGYLDLTISDSGIGIIESLRRRSDLHEEWFGHSGAVSNEELLAVAFDAEVTRDPGIHRPGRRGLFYVMECVSAHGGIVVCETGNLRLSITPQTLKPRAGDVKIRQQRVAGTHIRILLPIEATRRKRAQWSRLTFTAPSDLVKASITDVPLVRGLPGAKPLRQPNRRAGVLEFVQECWQSIGSTADESGAQDIIWLSAARTRRWRKQHIQVFLDQLARGARNRTVVIVNVPNTVATPMRFIAKYLLSSTDQQVVIIVTEDAYRAVVSQQMMKTLRDFDAWASSRSGYLTGDFTPAGQMMSAITTRFRSTYHLLSFNDVCHLASRVGIDGEFRSLFNGIALDPNTVVRGYVELDDATRDPSYTRTLSASISVSVDRVFQADGVIAHSRAAIRLLEHRGISSWTLDTSESRLPSTKWWRRHKRVVLVTDIVTRGQGLGAVLRRIRELDIAGTSTPSIVGIIAPIIGEATPPLPGKQFRVVNTAPRLAWLDFGGIDAVPLLWIHQLPVYETGIINANHAGEHFDLLPATLGASEAVESDMNAAAFIRLIEQRDALWFGHVEISGTHFDVEVDMTRLFAGSEALAEFAGRLAHHIVAMGVDLVVYPDESRIQFATTTAIDDALAQRDATMPPLIRAHRSPDGALFLTASDLAEMRKAQRILIVDDAINTGRTVKELLRLVRMSAPQAMGISVYPFISREPTQERLYLRSFDAQVDWKEFVRLPIRFWSEPECPQCQRAHFARAAATIASPLLQPTLLNFVKRVRAAAYGSDREPTASRRGGAVKVTVPDHAAEHFATLAGAWAAVAAVVSRNADNSAALLTILHANRYPQDLAAFIIYMVASRVDSHSSIWWDDQFFRQFATTVSALADVHDVFEDDAGHADPLLMLTMATWFAPREVLPRFFDVLMRALAPLLEHNTYFEEALVLALRMAQTSNIPAALIADLETTLSQNRVNAEMERRTRNDPEAPPTSILMRLRHVKQVAFREPVEQPWIEGVAHLLPILSYKGGHPRIGLIDKRSRGAALGAIHASAVAEASTDDEAKEVALREREQHIRALFAAPRARLEFLETSLSSALWRWFRALEFQHEWTSRRRPKELLTEMRAIEKNIARLRLATRRAEYVVRGNNLHRAAEVITEIAALQEQIYDALFAPPEDGEDHVRQVVEAYLTPITDLLSRHTRDHLRERFEALSIEFNGSFFELADAAALAEPQIPWVVVIAPTETLEDILVNALVTNPEKHVAPRYSDKRIVVNADLRGLEKGTQGISIGVRVAVEGRPVPLGERILTKTLGHRQKVLKLCGGDISVGADEEGRPIDLVVTLVAGLF